MKVGNNSGIHGAEEGETQTSVEDKDKEHDEEEEHSQIGGPNKRGTFSAARESIVEVDEAKKVLELIQQM
jgi:hypothetical protein